jgi:hypothetical protein
MKNVIIISRCLDVTRVDTDKQLLEFHFKGVFYGEVVKSMKLFYSGPKIMIKGEEYMLYVQTQLIHKGVLQGTVLKTALLEDQLGEAN